MTVDESRPVRSRRGLLRRLGAETIYLVTGGLLILAPVTGIVSVFWLMIAIAFLSPSYAGLTEEASFAARTTLAGTGVLVLVATLVLCWYVAALHRTRAAALLGVAIPRPSHSREVRGHARPRARLLGRMLVYHLIGLVLGVVMIVAVLICLIGGPALIVFALNGTSTVQVPPTVAVLCGLAGAAIAIGSPWILHGIATVDLALLRWVFGVDEKAALAQRVRQVTEARSNVVAAADAERRKIERNLHDGAQQRLTALAMHLGIERSKQARDNFPQEAQQALAYAQSEVQISIQAIRELVRGLLPAVLEDRGLDAAISGIASRAPFPVKVEVDIEQRPSIDIEAVAYFVVSEAINNAILHAEAQNASVTVHRQADTLSIQVIDDGQGGAEERRGSGLAGLRQRVESVDGVIEFTSQPGQGTGIRVELPCASS